MHATRSTGRVRSDIRSNVGSDPTPLPRTTRLFPSAPLRFVHKTSTVRNRDTPRCHTSHFGNRTGDSVPRLLLFPRGRSTASPASFLAPFARLSPFISPGGSHHEELATSVRAAV